MMRLMQTQQRRDEKTLQIMAALLVFVAVLGAGSLILVVAALTLGLHDSVLNSLMLVVIAASRVPGLRVSRPPDQPALATTASAADRRRHTAALPG